MITVEDLLMAFANAYDAWLDPETERKDPRHEYAELIRQLISFENAKLRELVCDLYEAYEGEVNDCWLVEFRERMRELGVEV